MKVFITFLSFYSITFSAFSKEPFEIFREKFEKAQESPPLSALKVGKRWDCYFIGAETVLGSYSATYRFEDFDEVIRGTYNSTKIHSYSYTKEGLMSRLNSSLRSYIRATEDEKLVIETTSNQLSHDSLQAISNRDRAYDYALCKLIP